VRESVQFVSIRPILVLSLAMTTWVITEAIAATTFSRIPVMQVVWTRYFFHLAYMFLLLSASRRFDLLRTRRPGLHLFRSMLMLTMPACYALAREAGGGTVMGIFWIAPCLVLLMAPLAGERPSRLTWTLSVIAWIGVLFMYRPSSSALGWSALAAVGMGASFSAYVVCTKVLDGTEHLLTNLFYTAVGVFVVLSLALPYFWVPMTPREFAGGALVAATGWATLYLLERAIDGATVSRLAPFFFVQAILEVGLRLVDRGRLPPVPVMFGIAITTVAFALAVVKIGVRPSSNEEAVATSG
jgi:hypothetical protein